MPATKQEPAPPPPAPTFTLREHIGAGPRFVESGGICLTCGDRVDQVVDRSTGLCRPCFRSWRWASTPERGTDSHAPVHGDASARRAGD